MTCLSYPGYKFRTRLETRVGIDLVSKIDIHTIYEKELESCAVL